MNDTSFCTRCGRRIDDDRRALYRDVPDLDANQERLCKACATEVRPTAEAIVARPERPDWAQDQPETPDEDEGRAQPSAAARPTDEVLDEILREVKHIARNQEYEAFSIWNIFGGLVQCLVLFLLFWRYAKGEPDLMWAGVLQVLALTLFVMAKK